MRVVVIGASSGLGRATAIGLGRAGHDIALLARRLDRLEAAVEEIAAAETAGHAVAIGCDVTDEAVCAAAVEQAADQLGGIDALVYATGTGPLALLADTDAATWTHVLATNVVGAAVATRAALPHLRGSGGVAVYFSSGSASLTPVWRGLGAYITSKAALDKLVEAWRVEHPEVGFTRLVVGDTAGGQGHSATGFADEWEPGLAAELGAEWFAKGHLSGALIDVDDLVSVVEDILGLGPSAVLPSVAVAPRAPRPDAG